MREARTENHYKFHSKNVFVIIQIKCIFNLDAIFSAFLFTQLKYNKKKYRQKRRDGLHWIALHCWVFVFAQNCRCVCVFLLSVEAAVQLIFIPNFRAYGRNAQRAENELERKKNECSTCPPKYPRYMRNCYYVALKNLLLSLRFCTYLQLISISIYFSVLLLHTFFWMQFFVSVARLPCETTEIRVIITMNEYFVTVSAPNFNPSIAYQFHEICMIFQIISQNWKVISNSVEKCA